MRSWKCHGNKFAPLKGVSHFKAPYRSPQEITHFWKWRRPNTTSLHTIFWTLLIATWKTKTQVIGHSSYRTTSLKLHQASAFHHGRKSRTIRTAPSKERRHCRHHRTGQAFATINAISGKPIWRIEIGDIDGASLATTSSGPPGSVWHRDPTTARPQFRDLEVSAPCFGYVWLEILGYFGWPGRPGVHNRKANNSW